MSDFEQTKKGKLNLVRQALAPGFGTGDFEHRPTYDQAEFKASFPEDAGRRDNRVSIRVSGKDLTELRKKALAEGIPIQAFIGNIIHDYVQGLLLDATDQRTLLHTPCSHDVEFIFGDSDKK